jgi:hypothetical protein
VVAVTSKFLHRLKTRTRNTTAIGTNRLYVITATNLHHVETHTIYYRDVPDILAKPIVFRKKVANRKELALIHEYLEGGGVNQPSPNPEPKRYSPWSRRPLIP